jgi:hypothetical protein
MDDVIRVIKIGSRGFSKRGNLGKSTGSHK